MQIEIVQYLTDNQRMYHYIGFCELSFCNNSGNVCLLSIIIYIYIYINVWIRRSKYSAGSLLENIVRAGT